MCYTFIAPAKIVTASGCPTLEPYTRKGWPASCLTGGYLSSLIPHGLKGLVRDAAWRLLLLFTMSPTAPAVMQAMPQVLDPSEYPYANIGPAIGRKVS